MKKSVKSMITSAIALASVGAVITTTIPSYAASTPMEKCYGVAKAGKNDCKTASHSCAGTTTSDNDPSAFVVMPQGLCAKLAGGNLNMPAANPSTTGTTSTQ